MAEVSTVVQQPPEFIEAAAKPYITQLQKDVGGLRTADLSQVYGPQFTAGLGALTQQAIGKVGGLGAYEPYLTGAAQAQQTAAGLTGPTAYQAYMSPYQQDVIDTTLQEFDIQTQKGLPALAQQAIAAGAFGGGREGVQRAEYLSTADRNRAALQAQLLQQGFGQAQNLAQQDFLRQQQLAQGQLQLAQQAPALAGQQISALTTLGGLQQGQAQAELAAQQQLAQQQLMQPLQATQALGSGITSLIAGYPGSTQTQTQPSPTPLQTALGAGATLAGVYRAFSNN
jgi:hypothetical protein